MLAMKPDVDLARLVEVDCEAVVELADDTRQDVRVQLVGGRSCYSVGGKTAEGPRWWRGEIRWLDEVPSDLVGGIEIWLRLDDGSSGRAVIEPAPAAPEGTKVIRGVGPPPFEVDAHT